jgi:hypothetical protein
MTKEFPMPNPETAWHAAAGLAFGLCHSLVIRVSSLDIVSFHPQANLDTTRITT